MKYLSYGLVISIFVLFFLMIYYSSYYGWGASPLNNTGGIYYMHTGGGGGASVRGATGSKGTKSTGNFRSGSRTGRGK